MKTTINTNLFPIISVGMYDSYLSPENMFDDYQINEDFENGDFDMTAEDYWNRFDNEKYTKEIQHQADNLLSGEIEAEGITIKIEVGELYSPRFYNFATDQVELTVDYDKDEILNFAKENKEEFNSFLKDNYSSYDGFSSSTANNYSEWLEDFTTDNVQSIGAVLTFIFEDEIDDYQENFLETCNENIFYSEFIRETI
jgi:hypothetical protein